jgi:hypothetical protein
VESVGASVNQFLDKLGNLGSGSPLLRQSLDLLGGRDFTSQKQPEQGLGKGLGSTRSSWELGLAFGDSLSSESNTLVGVENGSFPNKTLDTPHTSVCLVNSHLAKAFSISLGMSSAIRSLSDWAWAVWLEAKVLAKEGRTWALGVFPHRIVICGGNVPKS